MKIYWSKTIQDKGTKVSEHVRLCWHMQCPRWHVSEVVALKQCMQLHPPPNPIFHNGAPNALTRSSLWDSDWSTSRLCFFFLPLFFFSFLFNFHTHSSKIARWTIILCFMSNLIIVLFIVIYFVLGPFFNWFFFFLILSFNIWLVEN